MKTIEIEDYFQLQLSLSTIDSYHDQHLPNEQEQQQQPDGQSNNPSIILERALLKIFSYCQDDYSNKECLGDSKLKLFPTIFQCLKQHRLNTVILYLCLRCFWFASRNKQLRLLFCSREVDIAPFLLEMLTNTNNITTPLPNHIIEAGESILTNCGASSENHLYLFRSTNLLEYWKFRLLIPHPFIAEFRSYKTLNLMLFKMIFSHFEYFQASNIHEVILKKMLSYGNQVHQWELRDRVLYWAFVFLIEFTYFPLGCQSLYVHYEEFYFFFHPILIMPLTLEGFLGAMILLNIHNHHEHSRRASSSSPSSSSPSSIGKYSKLQFIIPPVHFPSYFDHCLLLLDFTLRADEEFLSCFFSLLALEKVYHGVFTLRNLYKFLRNLFHEFIYPSTGHNHDYIDDNNYRYEYYERNKMIFFMNSLLYQILSTTIRYFLDNSNECQEIGKREAGGGGQDYQAMEHLLRFLIELCLFYREEKKVCLMGLKIFWKSSKQILTKNDDHDNDKEIDEGVGKEKERGDRQEEKECTDESIEFHQMLSSGLNAKFDTFHRLFLFSKDWDANLQSLLAIPTTTSTFSSEDNENVNKSSPRTIPREIHQLSITLQTIRQSCIDS